MQKRTLSLIIGTALVMPSLAMAATMDDSNVTPADMRTAPIDNTLQAEIEGPDGELLATQPGEVEVDEMVVETYPEETQNPNMVQDPNMMQDPNMIQDPNMMQDPNMVQGNSANTGYIEPADERTTPAPNTLQEEIEGPSGELLATQPGEVEIQEQEALATDMAVSDPSLSQNSNANPQRLLAGEDFDSNVTPADERTTAVPITLQEKEEDSRGELLATQPGEVEVSEVRLVSVR